MEDYFSSFSHQELLVVIDVATLEGIVFFLEIEGVKISEIVVDENGCLVGVIRGTKGNNNMSLLIHRIELAVDPNPSSFPFADV